MTLYLQLAVYALILGSLYALSAFGLSLIYSLFRVLHFAHGHMLMLAAYLYWSANRHAESPSDFVLYFVLALLLYLIISLLVYAIFFAPFLTIHPLLPLITTLALSVILESIVSLVFGVQVQSLPYGKMSESIELAGVYVTPLQLIIIASTITLLSSLAAVFHFTAVGRKIRAMSENMASAQSLGIPRLRLSLFVFALASAIAGICGVFVAYETNLQPLMGSNYMMKGLAAMIVGGLGSLWGTVVASYLLGAIETFALGLDFWGYSLPAGYKDAFAFGLLLLVLLVRPEGIFGKRQRKV